MLSLGMFVWTSGFQNPLVHTDFNMFVDEWMSANESPACPLYQVWFNQANILCIVTRLINAHYITEDT